MTKARIVAAMAVFGTLAYAQVFDVASVRANRSGEANSSSAPTPGGGFSARNSVLRQLILEAYELTDMRLRGGPAWISSERFDIDARPAAASTPQQALVMFQALLADRFKLAVHWESVEVDAYRLTLAPGRHKLTPNTTVGCRPPCGGTSDSPSGRVTSRKVSLARFANRLADIVGRPVTDATGLSGEFDMDLDWAPDPSQFGGRARETRGDTRPALATALQEQLGLRLESTRTPIQILVIDRVERPEEN